MHRETLGEGGSKAGRAASTALPHDPFGSCHSQRERGTVPRSASCNTLKIALFKKDIN